MGILDQRSKRISELTPGQCCYIMFNTAAIAGVTYGTGRHALFLQPDEMMKAFRVSAMVEQDIVQMYTNL